MKKKSCMRQGDVLLVPMNGKIPDNCNEVPMSAMGPILALGEVTGHHHTVVAMPEAYVARRDLPSEDVPKLGMSLAEYAEGIMKKLEVSRVNAVGLEPACRLYQPQDGTDVLRYLDVTRPTILRHDEHGCLPITPGRYKVVRQQEKRPEGWRNVAD